MADGGPDLVFRNDTGKPILIRTSYTDQTLTVGFYSSPTGRTVHYQTSSQTGQTQPVTEYKYDATLPPGTISQQTSGEAGFDVSVTRTVLDRHGHTLRTDTFQSHYVPENLIYTVGRGAAVPKGVTVQGAPPPPRTEEEDQAVEPAVVDHDDADDHLQGHELGHGHDAADADAGHVHGAGALTSYTWVACMPTTQGGGQRDVGGADEEAPAARDRVVRAGGLALAAAPAVPGLQAPEQEDDQEDRVRAKEEEAGQGGEAGDPERRVDGRHGPAAVERHDRQEVEQVEEEADVGRGQQEVRAGGPADQAHGQRAERPEHRPGEAHLGLDVSVGRHGRAC